MKPFANPTPNYLFLSFLDEDGVFGRVPQIAIDDIHEQIHLYHKNNTIELQGLDHCATNAMKQYIKSRPNPSTASIKRTRELDATDVAFHPLFGKHQGRKNAKCPWNIVKNCVKNVIFLQIFSIFL